MSSLRRPLVIALVVLGLNVEGLVAPPGARVARRRWTLDATKEKQDAIGVGTADIRQLVGLRGASSTEEEPLWKIRLQLTKPATWIPLIWGVACGAAASGEYRWAFLTEGASFGDGLEDFFKAVGCMILSGPLLTGYTQTMNDWYDRDLDAINEPYRPIPSGRISEGQVIAQILVLLGLGLASAVGLDLWAGHDILGDPVHSITLIAIFGSIVSYLYSAPPFKLKAEGWRGCFALGASYIALPWWCGHAMFGELSFPVVVLTVLYSFAGLGIAIVNDFKSVDGDRALGLKSLPVEFGIDGAKYICASLIDFTQLGVAAYLYLIGEQTYAFILFGLLLPQVWAQFAFLLKDPVQFDVKYQASAQPFLVLGLLVTALAVGHHGGADWPSF